MLSWFTLILLAGLLDALSLDKQCYPGCSNLKRIEVDQPSEINVERKDLEFYKHGCDGEAAVILVYRGVTRYKTALVFKETILSRASHDMPPSQEEAERWAAMGQCAVGPTCPDKTYCWGHDADLCDSTEQLMWMAPGNTRKGIVPEYNQARETCTMGWECIIRKYSLPIYSNGRQHFIKLGSSEFEYSDKTTKFHDYGKFKVLVYPTTKCSITNEKAQCAVSKTKLGCRFGGTEGFYGNVKAHGCTAIGTNAYCIDEVQEYLHDQDSAASSVLDLKTVEESMNAVHSIMNLNMHEIQMNLYHVRQQIKSMMLGLIPGNPHLLDFAAKGYTYSRLMGGDIVEVCPCEGPASCETREDSYDGLKFCIPKNFTDAEPFKVFGVEDHLWLLEESHVPINGVPLNVALDQLEKDYMESHIDQIVSHHENALGQAGIKGWWNFLIQYLSIINLVLIILFIRRN